MNLQSQYRALATELSICITSSYLPFNYNNLGRNLGITIQIQSHNLARGTAYHALRGGVNISEISVELFKYDLHFICFLSPNVYHAVQAVSQFYFFGHTN